MQESPQSSTARSPWLGGIALAAVHLILALLFASKTPYMRPGHVFSQGGPPEGIYTVDIGAPDELQHVVLAGRLAAGEPYPVLKVDDPKMNFTYESLQPPLFYYLAAGWMKVTGVGSAPAFAKYLNDHTYQETEQVLKRGIYDEIGSSPDGVQSEGFRLRLFDALLGAGTILGVFALALWAFGSRNAAIAAAAFAALLPMNIALSGAISNDPLLICLCTWVLALLVKAARNGMDIKQGLIIGLLSGLAFLTKTTSLALVPVVLVALVFCRKTIPIAKFLPGMVLALLIGGFWWMHNQSVYGDPFAIKIFNSAFQGRNPTAEAMIARVGAGTYWQTVFELFARSFIGVFSYMDIYMDDWVYLLGKALLVLAGALGLWRVWATRKPAAEEGFRESHLINGVFLLVMILLFVQFNRGFFQAQARYVMPAIGPIGALFGLGVGYLADRSKSLLVLVIWIALWLAIFAQGAQLLAPEFAVRTLKPGEGLAPNP